MSCPGCGSTCTTACTFSCRGSCTGACSGGCTSCIGGCTCCTGYCASAAGAEAHTTNIEKPTSKLITPEESVIKASSIHDIRIDDVHVDNISFSSNPSTTISSMDEVREIFKDLLANKNIPEYLSKETDIAIQNKDFQKLAQVQFNIAAAMSLGELNKMQFGLIMTKIKGFLEESNTHIGIHINA